MSMKTIWKYELGINDNQIIEMPADAQILTVQIQHGKPCMWCLIDAIYELKKRKIRIAGTGHTIIGFAGVYIGTYQLYDGDLVFHVFDQGYIK